MFGHGSPILKHTPSALSDLAATIFWLPSAPRQDGVQRDAIERQRTAAVSPVAAKDESEEYKADTKAGIKEEPQVNGEVQVTETSSSFLVLLGLRIFWVLV